MLSNFKWYRRLKGGEWHLITVKAIAGFGQAWIHGEPNEHETVLQSEYYLECSDRSLLSDGFHTFSELYDHRCLLFIALANASPMLFPWKSTKHNDGSSHSGWFIAGLTLPGPSPITYHLPDRYWELLRVSAISKAPQWDGHTSQDVVERLKAAIADTVVERMKNAGIKIESGSEQ